MRSVTYTMGVSLDGYIVGPDGGFYWTAPDEEVFRSALDEVYHASSSGVGTANPLADTSPPAATGYFTDVAGPDYNPSAHGTRVDFDFGDLAPGGVHVFRLFYGAAANEAAALDALDAVGVNLYSIAKPTTGATGAPNTFMFAYSRDIPIEP